MNKTLPTIILLTILASIFAIHNPTIAHATTAQAPTLAVGDNWTYAGTATLPGLTLSLTLTLRVLDTETYTVYGNTYSAYRVAETASGSATGPILTAPVTETGYALWRQSDLAEIASQLSLSLVINGYTYTESQTQANTNPSVKAQWPLALDESWTNTVTTYTNQTTNLPNLPPFVSYSNTTTTTYVVTSTPLAAVGAGTYETYLIRASDLTGTSETYYSPQVMQPIKEVDYNSTGAVTSTISLQSFDAYPYTTSFSASSGGTNYDLVINTDVSATSIAQPTGSFLQSSTTITFNVNGTDGVTGRANITIPIKFNTTAITVKIDSTTTTTTILEDSNNYYVFFTYPLSSHTVTITYATQALPWLLIIGIIAAVGAVLVITTFLLVRRRKPAEQPPPAPATEPGQPPAPTPPAPTETPPPTPANRTASRTTPKHAAALKLE